MAKINVSTTEEERKAVLEALKDIDGEVVSVTTISKIAGLSSSRARYAIMDLLEEGKIERVPYRAMNKHYVRYSYNIK